MATDESKTPGVKVVVFVAEWCKPCKRAKPKLEEIKNAYTDVKFETVDIDKNPERAQEAGVTGMPFFTFYINDERQNGCDCVGLDHDKITANIEHLRQLSSNDNDDFEGNDIDV